MVLSFVWGESKKTYAVSSDLIWFDLDLGARGNQRDRDRERAQARKKEAKGKDDGLTPEQRRERDAKALQEKAAKKAAQAASGGGGEAAKKGTAKK